MSGYKGRRIKRDLKQMVLKPQSYLLQEKVVECVVLGEENIERRSLRTLALVVLISKILAFSILNIKNTPTIVFFFMLREPWYSVIMSFFG